MKKYLLILLLIIFLFSSAFLLKTTIFAQPSFELYSSTPVHASTCSPGGYGNNHTSYPLVDCQSYSKVGENIHLTVHAFDVSGIYTLIAIVKDPDGVEKGRYEMKDDGNLPDEAMNDDIYITSIDVSGWEDVTYSVDISATDWLSINSGDNYSGVNSILSFNLSGEVATSITDFTASPSPILRGDTARLTATISPGAAGQVVTFEDITTSTTIGTDTTNASGVAEIDYPIILGADLGEHQLKAIYGSSEQTATITVNNPTIDTIELWEDKGENSVDNPAYSTHAYSSFFEESRNQFIVLASDLAYEGLKYGDAITSIQLKSAEAADLYNFRIRMNQTAETQTTSWIGGWTTYFGPVGVPESELSPGTWKGYDFNLTTGLHWDGASNIIVDLAQKNDFGGGWGRMWWRTNVGANRTLVGVGDGVYDAEAGVAGAGPASSCPALKISYASLPVSGAETVISSFTAPASASALATIQPSATLKDGNGNPIAGEMIYFQDVTDGINIGPGALTNILGVAEINYPIGPYSTVGQHTLKAFYTGDGNFLSSERTTTINISAATIASAELWPNNASVYLTPTSYYHTYNVYRKENRTQFIILAAELADEFLTNHMLVGDAIIGIELKDNQIPSRSLADFRIRMQPTSQTTMTSWVANGWTTYFGPASVTVTATGWNEYSFSNNFLLWDGTSNIMVDLARTDPVVSGTAGRMYWKSGVGTNRAYAGYSITQYVVYDAAQGSTTGGSPINNCPALKIKYARETE